MRYLQSSCKMSERVNTTYSATQVNLEDRIKPEERLRLRNTLRRMKTPRKNHHQSFARIATLGFQDASDLRAWLRLVNSKNK